MAINITYNAKMRRTSICGATETILCHRDIAEQVLPHLLKKLLFVRFIRKSIGYVNIEKIFLFNATFQIIVFRILFLNLNLDGFVSPIVNS